MTAAQKMKTATEARMNAPPSTGRLTPTAAPNRPAAALNDIMIFFIMNIVPYFPRGPLTGEQI
jgi:hypothetical protein